MTEKLLLGSEMKSCDEYTINTLGVPSQVLMERAADAVVREIIKADFDIKQTVVVCGGGNNGGDGFAVARFLAEKARENGIDANIVTLFVGSASSMSEECGRQREYAKKAGISEIYEFDTKGITLIIDAIFGIGLAREITGEYKDIIDMMNASHSAVVAVDIPSGVNSDTGAVMGAAVKADMTVTFAAYKRGLLLYPGAELCGRVIKADIGIATEAVGDEGDIFTSLGSAPFPLPSRSPSSNKGTYGKVLIVGGAKNMAGAAYLSGKAAYRTGAGLVRIFTNEANRIILQSLLPEAVLLTYENEGEIEEILLPAISDSSVIVIGPGLSQCDVAKHQLETVIKNAECPLIIDADALNILSSEDEKTLWSEIKAPVVITPHMGEMSRLTGEKISDLKNDAIESARTFAAEKGVICCMKDARTVVSDGKTAYLNITGNSGMSKGGSGDVLTGVIAALIAQGMTPYKSACTGVYLHGTAGDLAAASLSEYSLLARDIADNLSKAISATK